MAVDLHDLLDIPYGFGECSERFVDATVTCECFENDNETVCVRVPMWGDWVDVSIPNIYMKAKPNFERNQFLRKTLPQRGRAWRLPKERIFWCITVLPDNHRIPAMVTMEEDGTIIINSKNSKDGQPVNYFTGNPNFNRWITTYSFCFAYVTDDLDHEFDNDIKINEIVETLMQHN